MSAAIKDYPSGALRVSDADRDRAIAELSEHFQAGRLTAEELEDRTGRALQARTAGELADLFADLPRKPPASPAPASASPFPASPFPASPGPLQAVRVPVVPVAIIAVVALVSILSGHPGLIALVPVLVLVIVRRLTGGRGRRAPR